MNIPYRLVSNYKGANSQNMSSKSTSLAIFPPLLIELERAREAASHAEKLQNQKRSNTKRGSKS